MAAKATIPSYKTASTRRETGVEPSEPEDSECWAVSMSVTKRSYTATVWTFFATRILNLSMSWSRRHRTNLNLAYGVYDNSRTETDYINWIAEVATAVKHILKPNGSFFLNLSGSNSRPYVPFEVMVRLRNEVGFHLQNHITWIKSIGIGSGSTGHFKPVPGRRFMHHNHEQIFHLTHENDVALDRLSIGIPFQDKSNIARRGHPRDLRCRGNTWFIPYPTVKTKAQKYLASLDIPGGTAPLVHLFARTPPRPGP